MCGIVGYSGIEPFDPALMKILFLYNDERGGDSCGYYSHREDIPFASRVYRKLGLASQNIAPEQLKPSKVFIGHTRKSTKSGSDKDVNYAHPFHFGSIIGVHNGSFGTSWGRINERLLNDDKDVDLDSKLLFKYISEKKDYNVFNYIEGGTAHLSGDAFTLFPDLVAGTNSIADSNGDDNLELIDPFDKVVDQFGVPGEDGSGTDHEFEDGGAFRKADVKRGNPVYSVEEWTVYNDTGAAGTILMELFAPQDYSPGLR